MPGTDLCTKDAIVKIDMFLALAELQSNLYNSNSVRI